MAVPVKYREMKEFHEYYSGKLQAPVLTVFFGGNHEASNHLFELYYGGWVAPNIYYLGAANVIRVGPLRIAGMSGIWKGYDYKKPHFERLPFSSEEVRSVFHVRELDVRKLLQIRTQVDICLTHDWPRKIEYTGYYKQLFRKKDMFQADSMQGQLGNPAARYLIDHLRPVYHLAGHLHIRFDGLLKHEDTPSIARDKQVKPANEKAKSLSAWNAFALNPEKDDAERAEAAAKNSANYFHRFAKDFLDGKVPAPTTVSVIRNPDGTKTKTSVERWDPKLKEVVDQMRKEREEAAAAAANEDEIALDDSDSEAGVAIDQKAKLSNSAADNGSADKNDSVSSGIGVTNNEDAVTEADKGKNASLVNDDEIDLDLSDSDQSGPEAKKAKLVVESERKPANTATVASNSVPDDIRAQLPASFLKPAKLEPATGAFTSAFLVEKMAPIHPPGITNKETRFLALDKCLAGRQFLHLVNVPAYKESEIPIAANTGLDKSEPNRPDLELTYDKEWLAILRVFASELSLGTASAHVPPPKSAVEYASLIDSEMAWVEENIMAKNMHHIPHNFSPIAPFYDPTNARQISSTDQGIEYPSPQTAAFCELIGIENKFALSEEEASRRKKMGEDMAKGGGQGQNHGHGGRGGGRGGFGGGRGHGGGFRGGRGGRGRGGGGRRY